MSFTSFPKIALLYLLVLATRHHVASQQLVFSITDPDDNYNETVISFFADATDTFDIQYDARKLRATTTLAIYSRLDNQNWTVQAFPPLMQDRTIDLGIDASLSGPHRLRLERIANADESLIVLVEDLHNGTFQNLRLDSMYLFQQGAGIHILRFRIHLFPPVEFAAGEINCDEEFGSLHLNMPGSYIWNYELKDDAGFLIDHGTSANDTIDWSGLERGTYNLNLIDQQGYAISKSMEVGDGQLVTANFEVSDSITEPGSLIHFFDYSTGAENILWDFGDGSMSSVSYPSHTYVNPGNYHVTFYASNGDCMDVVTKTVKVGNEFVGFDEPESVIKIYGSDGELHVVLKNMNNPAIVSLFNILGQQIFETKIEGESTINLPAQISPGTYLVKLTIGNFFVVQKVFLGRN